MKRLLSLGFVLALLLVGGEAMAQCPMCRATAESNLANGGTEGQGLNDGILYLLGMPYVIVGVVGYIWWRNRKRGEEEVSVG